MKPHFFLSSSFFFLSLLSEVKHIFNTVLLLFFPLLFVTDGGEFLFPHTDFVQKGHCVQQHEANLFHFVIMGCCM